MNQTTTKTTISSKTRNLGVSINSENGPEVKGGLKAVREELTRAARIHGGSNWTATLWVGGRRVVGCEAVSFHVRSGVRDILGIAGMPGGVEVELA